MAGACGATTGLVVVISGVGSTSIAEDAMASGLEGF